MEKEELTKELKELIQSKSTKTITLSEIYTNLKIPYVPASDKILHQILNELIEQEILNPLKTSQRDRQGSYKKYKIIQKQNQEKKIQNEILNTFAPKLDIQYFLKHPNEYSKNKEIIEPINQFLQNPDKHMLTVNERSYQLFKNEKKLKQNEEILKKLHLSYEDLYAYDTYEPFFYYINQNFAEKGQMTYKNEEYSVHKEILVIENKDTFWTMKKVFEDLDKKLNVFMVIYGEGKKILKSFSYIENFDITQDDIIQYFGDIDYEGINIYISLKEKYSNYNIKAYKKGYETILDIEQNPEKIRTKQNINKNYIQTFLSEFDQHYQEKLSKILNEQKYIPQEVFNYEVAKNIVVNK